MGRRHVGATRCIAPRAIDCRGAAALRPKNPPDHIVGATRCVAPRGASPPPRRVTPPRRGASPPAARRPPRRVAPPRCIAHPRCIAPAQQCHAPKIPPNHIVGATRCVAPPPRRVAPRAIGCRGVALLRPPTRRVTPRDASPIRGASPPAMHRPGAAMPRPKNPAQPYRWGDAVHRPPRN